MIESNELSWGPFRLMGRLGPLLRDGQPIKLQSKALSVLWMLAKQPGAVISKSELMDGVWPGMVVGEDALTFQIQALRRAVGDDPRNPRFIETVHRVGFRLRADESTAGNDNSSFVGRTAELKRLLDYLRAANGGQRQFIFVSGEAGIGKTTLIDRFVETQDIALSLVVARGQCVEQGSIKDAYLPFMQALQRLVRDTNDDHIIQLLRRLSPTWLVQMPGLLDAVEYDSLKRRTAGTPESRMLGELSDLLDALTVDRPLLLIIEDLHWSDNATVELLLRLASQRNKAKLMILCTLRPADAIIKDHPARRLQLDLRARKLAQDLSLSHLGSDDVHKYLLKQLGAALATNPLAQKVFERSNGHPLFMAQISEYLHGSSPKSVDEALALSATIPQGLRDLIELQLLALDETQQQLLKHAAVAGFEFSAASVAAASGLGVDVVESNCETLVSLHQFLFESGLAAWPDGTLSGRYQFRHALHQITLREQMPSARRARSHRQIAERMEAAYGERSKEIATDLALHFEAGGLFLKAAQYYSISATTSLQRAATTEVLNQTTRGLKLLDAAGKSDQTNALELTLHTLAANALQAQRSHATQQANTHIEHIERLMPLVPNAALIEYASGISWMSQHMRADAERALENAERTRKLARQLGSASLECAAHVRLGFSATTLGRFQFADEQSVKALKIISNQLGDIPIGVVDTRCVALSCSALVRWAVGFPDMARKRALMAGQCLQNSGNPYGESMARSSTILNVMIYRGDFQDALELCEFALPLCEQQGGVDALLWTRVQYGIARCMVEGSEEALTYLRNALAEQERSGIPIILPIGYLNEGHFCLRRGRLTEARAALSSASSAIERGVRTLESEALRLEGELLLAENPDNPAAAEKQLLASLRMAAKRKSLSLELRSGTSLARIWHSRGKTAEAHDLLKGIYDRFTEGFDTLDLTEARKLLEQLHNKSMPKKHRPKIKKITKN